MAPDSLFSICNSIALFGWIILIALPFWKFSDKFVTGIIITLFCVVYTWLIFQHFSLSDISKFSTLEGVRTLFEKPEMVLAGWIHYLAFDLLTGLFIKRNARALNIPHLVIAPCLFLTFMLGPIGLLLFLAFRIIYSKKYFAENV